MTPSTCCAPAQRRSASSSGDAGDFRGRGALPDSGEEPSQLLADRSRSAGCRCPEGRPPHSGRRDRRTGRRGSRPRCAVPPGRRECPTSERALRDAGLVEETGAVRGNPPARPRPSRPRSRARRLPAPPARTPAAGARRTREPAASSRRDPRGRTLDFGFWILDYARRSLRGNHRAPIANPAALGGLRRTPEVRGTRTARASCAPCRARRASECQRPLPVRDGPRDVALPFGEIAEMLLDRRVVGLPAVRFEQVHLRRVELPIRK